MEEAREILTGWITGPDTCFLIGAGCSICAEKPSIDELTEKVLEGPCDDELKQKFNEIKSVSARPPTIEDLMNYLIKSNYILLRTKNSNKHEIEKNCELLKQIKTKIIKIVDDDWRPSEFHTRFFRRLCSQNSRKRPCDIFSLNYDTILEASLDKCKIPYVDGFRGGNRAWFDPEVYNLDAKAAIRIYKLHGSINWIQDADGIVRCNRNGSSNAGEEPVVIYPSEQKYFQSQYGIYETLFKSFRDRLRNKQKNNCLVVLGYSFNDDHINAAIFDSIAEKDSNLTVFAFVGPEKDLCAQIKRFEEFNKIGDSRFNAFIGDESGKFIGSDIGGEEIENDILKSEYWKFENLVNFIAGN